MITQTQPIKSETFPKINRGLIQARHIQARLHGRVSQPAPDGISWSPVISGPFLVPVTRWHE
jgi:hypothetical protein